MSFHEHGYNEVYHSTTESVRENQACMKSRTSGFGIIYLCRSSMPAGATDLGDTYAHVMS
jgi:hypothetical protein